MHLVNFQGVKRKSITIEFDFAYRANRYRHCQIVWLANKKYFKSMCLCIELIMFHYSHKSYDARDPYIYQKKQLLRGRS